MINPSTCDPWPINLDLDCCSLPEEVDPALIVKWQAVASQILWALSGRRWGPCPVTVRPCRRTCMDQGLSYGISFPVNTGRFVPYSYQGRWYNASVCGCTSHCSCTELCEVYLQGPVYDIISVTIGGEELDPSTYRVDSPSLLVRTEGECWPSCQDLTANCDESGSFCVTYRWGLQLDDAAIAAVSELTCELIKACIPGCECRLPKRVQSVTRQGVRMDFPQISNELGKSGKTGLYFVDLWLSIVNPGQLPQASRVMSPDVRSPRSTIRQQL